MKLTIHLPIYYLTIILLTACCGKKEHSGYPTFEWAKPEQIDLSWANDVGAKQFPGNTAIYNANEFGAVNDTSILSTVAIQKAIDFCYEKGGGTVTLNPGNYVSGALFLKSGVNLQLDKEVVLYGSTNINDYPEIDTRIAGIEMVWPAALLNILDCENTAITGEGRIDCRGKVFWNMYWEMRAAYEPKGLRWIVDYDAKRVRGILISNSKDITLQSFSLMRTGFWGVQVLYSIHCTIDGLTINNNIGGDGPSTDGIDIDSSSSILIENCDIDCNDDNICLKAGRDADGLRVNRPTEYVVVRNCIARKGAGLITCGSETSGGIQHILGYNLKAYGTSSVLRLKSALNRGGFVKNIYISNVEADSVRNVLGATLNWNPSYSYSELPAEYNLQEIPNHWKVMLTPVEPKEKGHPFFSNVFMENIKANNVQEFISASGWNEELKLTNFNLYNMQIVGEKAGKIVFTDRFSLKEISLTTTDGDKILFRNNTNLTADVEYITSL